MALVFLIAGALLTIGTTIMVPAAYAGGDDHDKKHDGKDGKDGNKNWAEEESAAAIADCDKNDVERAEYLCLGLAVNDVDVDLGPRE